MLAFASIRSHTSKFSGSTRPCRDPNPPFRSVSGMHCGIDKSLCILLLLSPSLADQTLPFFSEICTFFVPVITFSPYFCANNYYTSLLLIVCALR